jgi:porin
VTIRRAGAGMNRGAIAAAAVLLGTPDAQAQDWSWFEQETATGDWGGARQRLVEAGVTPQASYTTDLLANPIGGARQGPAYAGNLERRSSST